MRRSKAEAAMLETKDITLENYERVYDYYGEKSIHPTISKLAHVAMRGVYDPELTAEHGSLFRLAEKLAAEQPVIFAANHVRYIDHLVAGAAMQSHPALRGFVGNTFILAKVPYFHSPAARRFNEALGCVPVFRQKDMTDDPNDTSYDMQIGRAGLALTNAAVRRIASGQNMFLFPEGTRNTENWHQLSEVKIGIGKIACKAWQKDIPVAIVPVGLAYGENEHTNWRGANVHIGSIIEGPFTSAKTAKENVQEALQYTVDQSNLLLQKR